MKYETNAFLTSILDLANTSNSYDNFLFTLIKRITEFLKCDIGHYYSYVLANDELESSGAFYSRQPEDFKAFIKVTKQYKFKIGIGLPGTAWKLKKSVNFKNIYKSSNFPRAKESGSLKIKGGLALPVYCSNQFIGVFEFYAKSEIILSQEELIILDGLSKSIGGIFHLFKSHRDFNLILGTVGEGIYGLDIKGNTSFVNKAACTILGYKEMELIGTPMHLKVHYAHPDGSSYPKERCPMYATFNEGKIHTIDNEVLWHKDGHPIPVRYTSIPIFEQDIIQGAVVTFMDISKEKAAIDALEELAHFDTLTHLPNRHSFSERLEQTLARAKRQNSYFAILFIDVDNFKDINDVHGHKFGDEVPVNFSIVVA